MQDAAQVNDDLGDRKEVGPEEHVEPGEPGQRREQPEGCADDVLGREHEDAREHAHGGEKVEEQRRLHLGSPLPCVPLLDPRRERPPRESRARNGARPWISPSRAPVRAVPGRSQEGVAVEPRLDGVRARPATSCLPPSEASSDRRRRFRCRSRSRARGRCRGCGSCGGRRGCGLGRRRLRARLGCFFFFSSASPIDLGPVREDQEAIGLGEGRVGQQVLDEIGLLVGRVIELLAHVDAHLLVRARERAVIAEDAERVVDREPSQVDLVAAVRAREVAVARSLDVDAIDGTRARALKAHDALLGLEIVQTPVARGNEVEGLGRRHGVAGAVVAVVDGGRIDRGSVRILADSERRRGLADEAAAVVGVLVLGAVAMGDAESLGDEASDGAVALVGRLQADVLLGDDRLSRQHVLERHAHADEDRLAHAVDLTEVTHRLLLKTPPEAAGRTCQSCVARYRKTLTRETTSL